MNNANERTAAAKSGVHTPSRRSDWLWKVGEKTHNKMDDSVSPSRQRLQDDCPAPCPCPAPECKICCCKGPCGSTTITEKKTKCGCVRTIETINKCGCTKNTIQKGPCGCVKTFERRDKCGNCEKRMEKVNQCGCCRMNLCIGPCGCTKTTETKTPCACIKTHEAKRHCGCLNIRETKNKCGCCKLTECILPGGRCCRCMEERNNCGCKKCIENVNKCKATCCKLQVCVGPQGCCKTQICKNPCMCYRATEGHNKAGCCKVSEWKNKCGCLKVSERRNKCGFGCKTTICKTPCGCRKVVESISPCGCSTCIEGCNKLCERGCCRVVNYKCSECKTKCKCDDEETAASAENAAVTNKAEDPTAAPDAVAKKTMDAVSGNQSRAGLYDVPQNPPGSASNRKRRFSCDTCEFCGGALDGSRVRSRSASNNPRQYPMAPGFVRANDDSFLYDVYSGRHGGVERRSGGESQPFTVSSILNCYRSSKLLNPFSLSNSLSKLSVLKLSLKDNLNLDDKLSLKDESKFLLTGLKAYTQAAKVCKSCTEKGVDCDNCSTPKVEKAEEQDSVCECAEGCCCFSCSPVPCNLGCCCPACCPALIVPKDSGDSAKSIKKEKRKDSSKQGKEGKHHRVHGERSKLNVKSKEHRHHKDKKDVPDRKPSKVLDAKSKTEIA